MSYVVRLAVPADAPLLPAIERAAGDIFRTLPDLAWMADGDVMSAEQHLDFIRQGTCWVAVDGDDQPVGFLDTQYVGDAAHIWEISVQPDLHGQGIGRALMAAAEQHAVGLGLAALTLTTFRAVAWNEGFYRGLGFAVLTQGECDARLTKILNDEIAHGLPGDRRCAMRKPLSVQ